MLRIKSTKMFVLMLLILFALAACGGNFVKSSYSTIYTAGTAYDAGMKSVSALQAQGKITPEQRAVINVYADKVYGAYQVASKTLAEYSSNMSLTTQNNVTTAINTMLTGWITFKTNVNLIFPNAITQEVK